jgi:NTE family protein
MSLGLALSGGGAKGAAHIGVLQALKEEGISVDYISGTSSGSIVATLYACGYNPYNILYIFNNYCKYISDYDKFLSFKLLGLIFTGRIKIKGLAKGKNLEKLLNKFCSRKDTIDIQDISMPIAIPTVDVDTGEVIYYLNRMINESRSNIESKSLYDDIPSYRYHGDIAKIVRASSSFPCVFEPKLLDNTLLIDGGVRVNSPVNILRQMGADKVLAVCFDENDKIEDNNCNIVAVTMKTLEIMGHHINKAELESADLVLRPSIKKVTLLDTKKSNYCATQGYNETKKNMDKIRQILGM